MHLARVAAVGLLAALCAVTSRAAPPPAALQGTVTQVIDGDTLRFTPAGQAALTVRLRDIDAPELCQTWGPEARRALSDMALNKPATLRPTGRDGQGRTVAVLVVEEANIGQRLVEEGHAWSLRARNDQGPLVKQERMAKALVRGLHGSPGAQRPWEFVRSQGACVAGVAPAPAPAPALAAALPAARTAVYRCDGRHPLPADEVL